MTPAVQVPEIRRMTPADLARVMEIASGLEHAPDWPLTAWQAGFAPQSTPHRIALVATEPESAQIIAFAVASLLPPQAELESIAVAAPNQRHGVARLLFGVFLSEIEPEGITEVLLEVRASNSAALEFYRGLGFAETGRRLRYYADPVEDAVLMSLHVG